MGLSPTGRQWEGLSRLVVFKRIVGAVQVWLREKKPELSGEFRAYEKVYFVIDPFLFDRPVVVSRCEHVYARVRTYRRTPKDEGPGEAWGASVCRFRAEEDGRTPPRGRKVIISRRRTFAPDHDAPIYVSGFLNRSIYISFSLSFSEPPTFIPSSPSPWSLRFSSAGRESFSKVGRNKSFVNFFLLFAFTLLPPRGYKTPRFSRLFHRTDISFSFSFFFFFFL